MTSHSWSYVKTNKVELFESDNIYKLDTPLVLKSGSAVMSVGTLLLL